MFRAGTDGCVHWGEPVTKIVEAVHTVLHGGLYVGSRLATRLLNIAIKGETLDDHDAKSLTDREWHVFIMIGQGLTMKQIADKLGLSQRTVESHRRKIKLKVAVHSLKLALPDFGKSAMKVAWTLSNSRKTFVRDESQLIG